MGYLRSGTAGTGVKVKDNLKSFETENTTMDKNSTLDNVLS